MASEFYMKQNSSIVKEHRILQLYEIKLLNNIELAVAKLGILKNLKLRIAITEKN
jgi:hypothetical protein